MQRPVVYLLLAYLSGIVLGYYCTPGRFILIVSIIPSLLSALIALLLKKKLLSVTLTLWTFCLTGSLFITDTLVPDFPPNHLSRFISGKKTVVEGVLYKAPQQYPDKTRYSVLVRTLIEKDREIPVTGRLLVTDYQPAHGLGYGDAVRFLSSIRRPGNFRNPGGFDYERFLAFQGIHVTGSLDGKHKIVKVGRGDVSPILYRIEQYRTRIREFFTARLSSPAAEIAIALITGEQSGIPEEMRERFAVTGVAHILAISGLNIGIIALVSMALVKALCRCSVRILLATDISKVAALITILPVIGYCLIAGSGIATVRATVMVITYLAAIIINRQDDLWNTLAMAAFLILLHSPSSLFDCSFQLSFLAVAAIIYLQPRLTFRPPGHSDDVLTPKRTWFTALSRQGIALLTVTLAATIGTAPLVALYFNRCSPWGIPANLLIVPLTGFLVVPLGLFSSLCLCCATPLALLSAEIMESLLNLSNAIAAFFATMPYADYRITTPTMLEITLYYAGLVALCNCRRSRRARYALCLVAGIVIIDAGCWYYHNNLNPRLRITMIDVGQGEATLVQLPRGKTMLIDGGGLYRSGFDIGGMVVAPLLWSKKIKHIDILVLSHPHPDHLNGLLFILKNFTVGEIWTNGDHLGDDAFDAFERAIAAQGIRKAVVSRGYPRQQVNGAVIEFLHPGPDMVHQPVSGTPDPTNNNSLVMHLTFRDMSFTFTGDIYAAAENEIMAAFPGLQSTVLKIPHHGSATSSSQPFLTMLRPRIALLSVGRGNSFNLPHQAVTRRYEDAGCTIFRTDRDGAITLETDGRSLWVRTHLQGMHISMDLSTP